MAISKLKTIILRFRDLFGADTICEHNKIIESNGYVWWGWWAKPQEKVPFNEFSLLKQTCNEPNGLKIMLFDSGNKCLYEACCTDIYYCNGDRIKSKEPSNTPTYYAASDYMAWFKFVSISERIPGTDANAILKKLSYYKVDDFFVSGHSSFIPFYNKRIYSMDELFEQQRTIWFVRDYERGDKSHEIHSYSMSLSSGKNVDTDFRLLTTNNILWVSDLHFSQEHHAFMTEPGNDNRLSIRLSKELDKLPSGSISSVIISGDFTYEAKKDEYGIAEDFITDINSIYKLDGTCYSFCPGNHDIVLSKNGFKEDEKVTVAFEQSKENYVDFYRTIKGIEPTDSLYSIRRLLTQDLLPVEIISVNSCLLQQGEHFMGMGFVGNDQLASIEKNLALTKDKNVVRILVMHHHLLPVMFSEKPRVSYMYSMMLDSEAISQFAIKNRIGLVLHGHTHKNYYSEIIREDEKSNKRKFHVIGLGSTGAIQADLSENRANMFSTLTFSEKELLIRMYDIKPSGESSAELKSYSIPIEDFIKPI